MKKGVLLFLLALAVIIVLGLLFKNFISASIFDTAAAYQATTLNVTVDMFPPDLIVDSPTSTTYTTDQIDINYSVSDSGSGVNTIWYNIDSGSNTTLTENVTRTVANGDHTLFIYANDSSGLVNDSEFVSFTVSTAAAPPGPTGQAAGGGRGLAGKKILLSGFDVDTDMIKVQLKRGERLKKDLVVKNTGDVPLTFTLNVERLESFIFTPEKSFILRPGESKDVGLEFTSNAYPDVYTGRLVLETEDLKKFVSVVLELESDKVLYDATLDIPAKYTKLTTEREIPLIITIFNIAGPKTAELEVEYLIITGVNGDAEVIARENETIRMDDQVSFTKTLKLPKDVPYGEYLAIVKVKYGDSVGTTSRVFEIVREPDEISSAQRVLTKNFIIVGIVIILILSFAVFSSSYAHNQRLKNIERSQVKRLTHLYKRYTQKRHVEEKKEKALKLLEKEQALLDDAFKQNYISKESYSKGKQRIDDLRKKIK